MLLFFILFGIPSLPFLFRHDYRTSSAENKSDLSLHTTRGKITQQQINSGEKINSVKCQWWPFLLIYHTWKQLHGVCKSYSSWHDFSVSSQLSAKQKIVVFEPIILQCSSAVKVMKKGLVITVTNLFQRKRYAHLILFLPLPLMSQSTF